MLDDIRNSAIKNAARAEFVKGLLWLVGALAISGITYAAADPGGSYMLFWGAALYGGYRFLRGLYYFVNPGALAGK